jgi:membrane-bound lytic murein transglycosylase B
MSVKMAFAIVGGLVVLVLAAPGAVLFLLAASLSPLPPADGVPVAPAALAGAAAVPAAVVAADDNASTTIGSLVPGCTVPPGVLLGIGMVESGNTAGRTILPGGEVSPPVIGPALDGSIPGTAAIPATDGGRLDGDPVWEHAVGPMQILPSTWERWGRSTSGATPDPQNINDAALTAAVILCQPPRDLSDPTQLGPALFSYNHSAAYVAEVESWVAFYEAQPEGGVTTP